MHPTLARVALPLLLMGAAALPAPAGAQTAAAAPATVLRGDVNGDGQVTVLDALAVLASVVGKPLPGGYVLQAGDADGSGQVTAVDALVIAGYAAGRDVSRFPVGKAMPAVRADAVECAVDAAAGTISCATPRPSVPTGSHAVLLGGQDVYVRLTSRNTHFDSTTRVLSADVRVTNLLTQRLGLGADGHPSPDGVRVFFNTISASSVSVMNGDGEETFLAPGQTYYQYDGPLAPGDSTASKKWMWHLPAGVNGFTFRVYATGEVQYPGDNDNLADADREREQGVTLNLVSGGGQTGVPGQPLPQPVVVRVLDARGQPFADRVVNFMPRDGGSAEPMQARTDSAGYASTTWTLGTGGGTHEMHVAGTGGELVVTASSGPAPGPLHLALVSGSGQHGAPGGTLPAPLVARVTRDGVGPVAGIAVAWAVTSGGGTVQHPATVSDSLGLVQTGWTLGPAEGMQTARASLAGGDSVTFTAVAETPRPVVARVAITPDSLVLAVGDTGTFAAGAFDAGGAPVPGTATWTSSDTTIARVSATGRVTAAAVGTVQVTATIAGVSASATVRVKPVAVGPVVRVVVSPDSFIMYPNQRRHFTATAYDAAGHVVNAGYAKWKSSDSTYVNVDLNGYVLALGAGTTTITATIAGVSGTGRVFVPLPSTYPVRVTWIERRSVECCKIIETGPTEFGVNYWVDVSRASSSVTLHLRSPAGDTTGCVMASEDDYIRRTFRCSLTLPANSAPGIWKVDRMVVDGRVLSAADLDSMATPGRREVVLGPSVPDVAPPLVTTVVPQILSGGVYYVKFGVVDFTSNVTSVSAAFRGQNGQRLTCSAFTSTNEYRVADWLCKLPGITTGSGRWSLESVTVSDARGNTATYTQEQIEAIRGVFEYTFLHMDFDA